MLPAAVSLGVAAEFPHFVPDLPGGFSKVGLRFGLGLLDLVPGFDDGFADLLARLV